jgi:hypothetical protein
MFTGEHSAGNKYDNNLTNRWDHTELLAAGYEQKPRPLITGKALIIGERAANEIYYKSLIANKNYTRYLATVHKHQRIHSLNVLFSRGSQETTRFRLYDNHATRTNRYCKKRGTKYKFALVDSFFVKHPSTAFSFYWVAERKLYP